MEQTAKKLVRAAFHAGSWYAADQGQLDGELTANLGNA